LGILEKKVDYKKRAVDFHRKEDRVNNMRKRASMRNPDEFYFGMHKTQIVDGKHKKTKQARQAQFDAEIGADTIRLMKDQDLSYIRMQKQKDVKKIESLRSNLHFLDQSDENTCKRTHTVFVDSREEAEDFDVAKHFDTLPELAGRSFNRPRVKDIEQGVLRDADEDEEDDDDEKEAVEKPTAADLRREEKQARKIAKKLMKARESSYTEMQERTKRARKLERAEAHLVTEKLVAGKGRKRKIAAAEKGEPAQYKWRRKRLR
jgi:U3 small nucleolar RNA-associated protein 11